MRSDIFQLNLRDLLHGFLVAVVTSVTTGIVGIINNIATTGSFPDLPTILASLKTIGLVGLLAGIGYLGKQLGTNADGTLGKKADGAGS